MQSDIVQRLLEIRAFLDGSGELNGLSFGDRTVHPATGKPVLFWWRRELTALDEAAAELTRLTEALRDAEEREKGLREAAHPFVFAVTHCKVIGKRPHDFVLTSEFDALAQALARATP